MGFVRQNSKIYGHLYLTGYNPVSPKHAIKRMCSIGTLMSCKPWAGCIRARKEMTA